MSYSVHGLTGYGLRYLGDPALQRVCDPVPNRTAIDRALVDAMERVLRERRGFGLAAPQVGGSRRIIMIRQHGTRDNRVDVLINPRIVSHSSDLALHVNEGCLSIPGFYTSIRRHSTVVVEYVTQGWSVQRVTGTGVYAYAYQHEIDHLDGKLITDGLSRQQRRQAERLVMKALSARSAPSAPSATAGGR